MSPNYVNYVTKECFDPDVTYPEINHELAKQQKPNHMYLGVYQPSCSTHPRAEGYAHEDNYQCLTNFRGMASVGSNFGSCCDTFLNCVTNATIFRKTTYTANGYVEYNTQQLPSFNCKSSNGTFPYVENGFEVYCDNATGCKGGYIVPVGLPFVIAGGGGDTELKNSFRTCKSVAGRSLAQAYLAVTFFGAGNMDCGCSGEYKDVKVVGMKECSICFYMNQVNEFYWASDPVPEISCTNISMAPATFCECVFNKQYSDVTPADSNGITQSDVWVTNVMDYLRNPTTVFPDWKKIIIDSNGNPVSIDCAGEQMMSCNSVR